ncbi:hypothetical protein Ahy_B07g088050 [Arachis hypogaea]|uniref:Uncharacterized protein n=1 Tax=Arachis hypogaea TaxID=3818 RepID=A0A444YDL1_ARAHY|nr:hypothetical protein Ahy_B07g088050 [Arachis hypogaea]
MYNAWIISKLFSRDYYVHHCLLRSSSAYPRLLPALQLQLAVTATDRVDLSLGDFFNMFYSHQLLARKAPLGQIWYS